MLLHRDRPTAARAAALHERLHGARPDEVQLIREALAADPPTSGRDRLLGVLLDEAAADGDRLRAAWTLAAMPPAEGMPGWAGAGESLTDGLLAEEARTHPRWLELLGPAADILVPTLRAACGQPGNDPTSRASAAEALAWILSDRADPVGLARAIAESQPDASLVLLRRLAPMPNNREGLDYLRREADGADGDDLAISRSAIAAVALAYLGDPEALEQAFRHREDPRLRTEAIQVIVTLNLAPRLLRDRPIRGEADGPTRQAAWMVWAETPPDAIGTATRNGVLRRARQEFLDDPDPGVHSAVELLIRRWDTAAPPSIPAGTRRRTGGGERGWEIGPNGHTLIYVRGPLEFVMGSPEGELPPKRWPYENLHGRRIDRSLLVAATETTITQYREFKADHPTDPRYRRGDRDDPDQPAGGVSWYEAVRYCNWLSRKAGLAPFYPDDVKPGDPLPAGGQDLGGFRLPTEAEWEYLCRAGTRTCRPFGEADRYLNRYARTWLNSRELSGPVGRLLPNELGLFDMLGSQWEWCGDGSKGTDYYPAYPAGARDAPDDFGPVAVNSSDWRVVRGGSFDSAPSMARSAHRDIFTAKNSRYFSGFRVVRTATPQP
ncbi:MAG: formylglycine-generating enzyme family protein [Isosphaeraceae bacterium]